MQNVPGLKVLAALIMAWGAALIAISFRPGKEQVHSLARRLAGATSGLAFVLAGAALFLEDSPDMVRKSLGIAAVIAVLVSWYIGRHVKKVDRALH